MPVLQCERKLKNARKAGLQAEREQERRQCPRGGFQAIQKGGAGGQYAQEVVDAGSEPALD